MLLALKMMNKRAQLYLEEQRVIEAKVRRQQGFASFLASLEMRVTKRLLGFSIDKLKIAFEKAKLKIVLD